MISTEKKEKRSRPDAMAKHGRTVLGRKHPALQAQLEQFLAYGAVN